MDDNQKFRTEYAARINRVIDYIERNIDQKLTLDDLARIAAFSPFHFHRIFATFTGETLNRYINRLRLQKAASMLISTPDKPITDIALDMGFSASSSFARAFSDYYGMSASDWRSGGWKSNIGKMESNCREDMSSPWKDVEVEIDYKSFRAGKQLWRFKMKENKINVEVRTIEKFEVAYIRHVGPYAGDAELFRSLFEKLARWAAPRGLLSRPDTMFLSIYHDDPNICDEDSLRTSICVRIHPDDKVDGEIGRMEIPAGQYAFAHFELDPSEYGDAWGAVMGGWLPKSGFQCDDRPTMEWYMNDPESHPEKKHVVEIVIPVKPL
ncbi:AraC family transcriptional regulator [Myxococcota bacterium]|nr:AraC family transcriptional regulator [Myxococcota bacterium]MBU1380552.1 AraC family transcriptional regulator [Myxococcota bacterium]MBU1497137.1 AraC family transcriptional regulator [Myxococcota bacterium]